MLAYPDLADKLVNWLGYERPQQWNGFVPPATWNGARNDSPRRAALVDICGEAMRRERAKVQAGEP